MTEEDAKKCENPETKLSIAEIKTLGESAMRDLHSRFQLRGAQLIAAERLRQQSVEGWTKEKDFHQQEGELAIQAADLILTALNFKLGNLNDRDPDVFGLSVKHRHDIFKKLIIAGALVAAEIDRLLVVQDAETKPVARVQ